MWICKEKIHKWSDFTLKWVKKIVGVNQMNFKKSEQWSFNVTIRISENERMNVNVTKG